ncbi:hypothetical protein [Halocynthiibacter styelae]|uniref:Uncharacterized protein n=1 Tax=Halocynthiibacter styelae TaxID=2761955 RepID=A0A8J7IRV4_9RHOB|nr:hypothetical protein [Paenihalocynthiibacter styelae]MBI1494376.1 hypothetical protein [Paenihalocynthiibacter styelae]
MVKLLKSGPLPNRIPPPTHIRDWLWSEARAYDGILIPANKPAKLIPFLEHEGTLVQIDAYLCFRFASPVFLDPAKIGVAMPLLAVKSAGLCSYDLGDNHLAHPGSNQLHIVQHGKPVSYDLHSATHLDPLTFWEFSDLTVLSSVPLPEHIKPTQTAPPEKPQTPKLSVSLDALGNGGPVFGDIRNAVEATSSRNTGDIIRQGARLLRGIFASILIVVLGLVVIMGSLGILTTGARGGFVGLLFAVGVIYMLWKLFSGFGTIGVGQGTPRSGQWGTPQRHRGPGMFERLKSWALWNTNLGDKLRDQISRNINDVSRMIKNGEIDRALKHAIALGEQQEKVRKPRTFGPTSAPKPRASLDMDISGIEPSTSSILNDTSFLHIANQYRQLASKLSSEGDHKRAAFIYSELLKDVPKALDELEKLRAYEDAAKLATARKSPGAVIARLWFLTGKKEIALTFARRHDAMEYIANISEKTDPAFAAFLRGHWIQDLIAAGDLARAVEQSAGRPELRTLHVAVTKQAVLAGLLDEAAVLLAATCTLEWRLCALTDCNPNISGDAIQQLEARLYQLAQNADPQFASMRRDLLAGLVKNKPKDIRTEDRFWLRRVTPLTDAVIRAVLAFDRDDPAAAQLPELQRTARAMDASVLAEDLRHIIRKKPTNAPQKNLFTLPPPPANMHQDWSMIACVSNHRTLVGSTNGELVLLDENGKRCWTDQLNALVDIIPIGPGRLVILIQEHGIERRLTLLDTALHSYRDLGHCELLSWHHSATAAAWMVQTRDAVGALDISALLGDTPDLKLLWSTTQTVPLIVRAFHIGTDRVQWLSQRLNNGTPGLIETWSYTFAQETLTVRLIEPELHDGALLYEAQNLWTTNGQFWPTSQTVSQQWQPKQLVTKSVLYSFDEEKRMTGRYQSYFDELPGFAQIAPSSDQGNCLNNDTSSPEPTLLMWQHSRQPFVILKGVKFVAQSTKSTGRRLALIDSHQRIVLCDFHDRTMTLASI